jgi:colanic acid/amylovoran biosynthesis glycosyltransferase
MVKDRPVVAHSLHSFLPTTCSWIYTLLVNLKKFEPIVITKFKWNLQNFPFDAVYSFDDFSKVKQLAQRVLRRVRRVSYLPFEYKVLKNKEAKLLHSHFGDLGYKNLELRQSLKIPHVVSFYGYDFGLAFKESRLWEKRFERLFSEGDLFLAEGNYSRKRLVELGCPQDKIAVQHLGIDLNKVLFQPRKIGSDGVIKILIASSFLEKKGIPVALEAIGKINKKYNNIRVCIIGDSPQINPQGIEEKKKILYTLRRFNLGERTALLGYQPHAILLKEAYKAHIFIAPSIHARDGDCEGGAPVAIIEMSASGMPVISTYHCDIPEVVLDGESGFLVRERDPETIAEHLEYLINNPQKWEELGRKGRRHIEDGYDILKQVNKMEDIYLKVIR